MTVETPERARPEPIKAVPVRHPGRWVAIAVLAVLAAMFVNTILTNPGFRWPVVGEYLFSPPVLNGLSNTLVLTLLSMAIGIVGMISSEISIALELHGISHVVSTGCTLAAGAANAMNWAAGLATI